MKLAISCNILKNFPLYEGIKIFKSIGYDGVELLTDIPHFYPPQTSLVKLYETVELLDSLQLGISNINAFMFFAVGNSHSPSYFDGKKRYIFTQWSIYFAGIMQCKNISIEPAGKPTTTYKDDLENFAQVLYSFKPLLQRYKVKILVEPEPQLLIENVNQALELMQLLSKKDCQHTLSEEKPSSTTSALKISSDDFLYGINADIGHFFCVSEPFEKVFTLLKDFIGHIHLEDINKKREHFHLVPGEGAIDFSEVLYWLKKINYDGWVTVELYPFQDDPISAAQRAFTYLKKAGF